jgi:hypothetical protein
MTGSLTAANITKAPICVLLRLEEVDRIFNRTGFVYDLMERPQPLQRLSDTPAHLVEFVDSLLYNTSLAFHVNC